MPFLILLSEILLVYYFIQFFGFLNFIFFYILSSAMGILVFKYVGAKTMHVFQTGQVTSANRSMISRGLLFLSGLLLIIPSMGTKVFGLILLLPPARWLISNVFTGFLLKRVFGSKSFVHQFGNGGFKFYYQSRNSNETPQAPHNIIDAEYRKIEDPKLLK